VDIAARANAEGLNARFIEGDAEALPFEDASFDVVTSLVGRCLPRGRN
jgi:ubiquinone/menaquinone biosynthesis C-methylase UbiE